MHGNVHISGSVNTTLAHTRCTKVCVEAEWNELLFCFIIQASFDPPGITIAVKKDRGMETMLQPGNAFAVSMVPETQEKVVMKV